MTEEWRPCFGGAYEVSNIGRVRRLSASSNNTYSGRLRKVHVRRDGYCSVRLQSNGDRDQTAYTHKLVAEAFIGQCPTGFEVNHKNGIRSDNRVENLEYVSASQNLYHAVAVLGRCSPRGSRHSMAKLTEEQVVEIRKRSDEGEPLRSLSLEFGVVRTIIDRIVKRQLWRHVQ